MIGIACRAVQRGLRVCIVMLAAGLTTAVASAGAATLSTTVATAAPEQAVPVQLTFSGTADPGDGSTVDAEVRPAGGTPCQPSFSADRTAAGNASTTITDYDNVSPGSYADNRTWTPGEPGSYIICAWLVQDNNTVAGPITTPVQARGPQVQALAVGFATTPLDNVPFHVVYTTQTDQQLDLGSIIKPAGGLPCASSFELEHQQDENISGVDNVFDYFTNVYGGPVASTATVTEGPGSYLICTYVEGPDESGEVDAALSTPFSIAAPPPKLDPDLAITALTASTSTGISVAGTTAAAFAGTLKVVASCNHATSNGIGTATAGAFTAGLALPAKCAAGDEVTVKVSWLGSSTTTKDATSAEATAAAPPVQPAPTKPKKHKKQKPEKHGAALPTVYSSFTIKGSVVHNVFSRRPTRIVLDSADGGELVLDWHRWTSRQAVASGVAHPDHGHYRIKVLLSRPIKGTFACMTITSNLDHHHEVDRLGLGRSSDNDLGWFRLGFLGTKASGSKPWPSPGCSE